MNWDQIGNWFVMFLSGCGVALEIFAVTLVCAIPLGVLLSFGRRSKYKVISWPVSLYISIMRGTPLLLQLLFVYFAPKYMFGLNYDRFLPQVIKRVIPSTANEVITLVKDTSLAYALSVEELFFMANKQTNANGVITPLIIAGIYYYFFNLLLSLLFRFIEKKLNYYK